MLAKQETLLGRGAQEKSSRVRQPRRTAPPRGSQSWGSIIGINFQVVSDQSL